MGTLVPRLWSKNKRIFWRDLHAVPGFYGVLLIAFLLLTGLPWTGFWGDTFVQVWGRFPDKMWDKVTGAVMGWQRRPKGSGLIGAPPMPPYVQHWKIPLIIVAVSGLVFPLLGLSLVAMLLLDYLYCFVRSRIASF